MTGRFALPLALGVSVLTFAAQPVFAASVVFTNFGAGLSFDASSGNPVGNAFDGNDYAEADSFTSSLSGSFRSLTIALSCVVTCADPVTVGLAADGGGQPGTVLESFSVSGASLAGFGASFTPVTLSSALHPGFVQGSVYWVTVKADLNDVAAWNLNTSADISAQASSTDNGATWFSPSGNTPGALEVDATVPEPATSMLLLAAALVALIVAIGAPEHGFADEVKMLLKPGSINAGNIGGKTEI
jgi:hypothetical protein